LPVVYTAPCYCALCSFQQNSARGVWFKMLSILPFTYLCFTNWLTIFASCFGSDNRNLTSDAKGFPLDDMNDESSSQFQAAIKAKYHKHYQVIQVCSISEYAFRQRLVLGNWSEDCVAQENYTCKCPMLDPPPSSSCYSFNSPLARPIPFKNWSSPECFLINMFFKF